MNMTQKPSKAARPELLALQKATARKAAELIHQARLKGFVPRVTGDVRRMKI